MAQFTSSSFVVADGKGAPTREFTFDTKAQGDVYRVTISFDGSGPIPVKLSKAQPTAPISETTARVRPSGTLSLSYDETEPTVLILFDGTLHTAHSTSMTNACVGAID